MYSIPRLIVSSMAGPSRIRSSRFIHCSPFLRNAHAPPSPLELSLRDGLKTAMKARDRPAATTLKAILADITNIAKASSDPNSPASRESVITALRKAIDKRNLAAESYSPTSSSPHPENHSSLLTEIELLKSYLPSSPSIEQLRSMISEITDSLDEEVRNGKGAIGEVMRLLWEKLGDGKASVDRKEVGKIVNEVLKGK